jgi:hypothetical protein
MDANFGLTKVRLMIGEAPIGGDISSACDNMISGNVEDYYINILDEYAGITMDTPEESFHDHNAVYSLPFIFSTASCWETEISVDWIELYPMGGIGASTSYGNGHLYLNNYFNLNLEENLNEEARQGTITIRNAYETKVITINQEGIVSGINNKNQDLMLSVYPNPTTNLLLVDFGTTIISSNVEIFNIRGEQMLSIPISGNNAEINVSVLENGAYQLLIDGSSATFIKN